MNWILSALVLLLLIPAAVEECYQLVFSVPKKGEDAIFALPETEQYRPFAETTRGMIRAALDMEYEPVSIVSHDGLKLFGKVYASGAAAPWLILFHGYRSRAERDFCGGLRFGVESGYNVLLVDQRAHGRSEGKGLSFGVLERRDCLSWVNFVVSRAGEGAKIVLYGMSMGAASILQSMDLELNKNVRGVIADCGYSDLNTVFRNLVGKLYHLPTMFVDVFEYVNLLKAGYGFKEASSVRSVSVANVPLVYICGDCDRYVPKDMALEIFNACRSPKRLLLVPGAGHAASYMCAKDEYEALVRDLLGGRING